MLPWLALGSGAVLTVGGLALVAPGRAGVLDGLSTVGVPLFWAWMLWTGVLVWLRAPARIPEVSAARA